MVNAQVIFMFPGQGSQTVGMAKDIAAEFAEADAVFEQASEALSLDMKKLCFEDEGKQLGLTEFTQPALLTVSTAVLHVIKAKTGVVPAFVAGHSLGEYSALVAAGALGFADALRAVRFRGQAMQRAVPVGMGAMAAYLGAKCDEVVELCKTISTPGDVVEVVNFNSASQLVLSGHKSAVEKAGAAIGAQKLGRSIPLPVSAPFHSSLMKPAAEEMKTCLEKVAFKPLSVPLCANIDGHLYKGAEYTRALLVGQVASAVLWTQSLKRLQEAAVNAVWIEVGAGNVLQGLLKKTLEGCTAQGTGDAAALKTVLQTLGS